MFSSGLLSFSLPEFSLLSLDLGANTALAFFIAFSVKFSNFCLLLLFASFELSLSVSLISDVLFLAGITESFLIKLPSLSSNSSSFFALSIFLLIVFSIFSISRSSASISIGSGSFSQEYDNIAGNEGKVT